MLTQDDYQLYTGESVSYTEEQWERIVAIAMSRLAAFLCLDSLNPIVKGALTAEEYDALVLMAKVYDAMKLSADDYDNYGKAILMGGGSTSLPPDLAMLLSNFISIMLHNRGGGAQVQSKRVRNFSVTYAEGQQAFGKLKTYYGDIIEKYSQCKGGVCVECSARRCCNGCF